MQRFNSCGPAALRGDKMKGRLIVTKRSVSCIVTRLCNRSSRRTAESCPNGVGRGKSARERLPYHSHSSHLRDVAEEPEVGYRRKAVWFYSYKEWNLAPRTPLEIHTVPGSVIVHCHVHCPVRRYIANTATLRRFPASQIHAHQRDQHHQRPDRKLRSPPLRLVVSGSHGRLIR